ncbi:unnamed protein product [Nesidiocoris tenuis]|uniref:SWIM-type domain-containing protein n=1 Tax=Nesidiocoris tenuis TaxID=355587 RepID=A0A6H5H076_9HEMI|nr:unnamed protein product [Nesidiocoris tenuis]
MMTFTVTTDATTEVTVTPKRSRDVYFSAISLAPKNATNGRLNMRTEYKNSTPSAVLADSAIIYDRLCSDDVRSLEAWINTFGGDSGVVRFYKPQSTILAGHPELHYEDCILILANNAQINALNQFASNVICIDGTRGNNPRNFELHTLLVKDAKRQCIPCAFMVSNRIDAEIMGIFIAVIKTLLLQPIAPKVLIMSDVNYNVWVSAMPPPEYWLLCPWHVDQAWRKNLAKIGDPKKRWTAYKLLQTVMDEPDENATDLLLQNALVFMASDPDLVEYDNFFRSEYLSSIQFWAYCFRNHLDINMGAMLDSVRNIIKRFYLDGKQQKPLEKGVNDLLKFVLDKFQDDPTQENLSSEILAMRDRHARSADLEALVITREPGSDWLISSSSQTALCEVKKTANRCDCEGKCEVCAVCIHEYRCTCNDYMKSNLCKHIHRITMEKAVNERFSSKCGGNCPTSRWPPPCRPRSRRDTRPCCRGRPKYLEH